MSAISDGYLILLFPCHCMILASTILDGRILGSQFFSAFSMMKTLSHVAVAVPFTLEAH